MTDQNNSNTYNTAALKEDSIGKEYLEKIRKYEVFKQEANNVREKDKKIIRDFFKSFSHRDIQVGVGFQRAYGSIISGDHFDLFKLSDKIFLFIFADISGHGLPAYTTLIKLRSAIILAVKEMNGFSENREIIDYSNLIRNIAVKFTDIMDLSNSNDFASVNFVFVEDQNGYLKFRFYNRSMLFPIIIRRSKDQIITFNLNNQYEIWQPKKGYLLGNDIKSLVDIESYYSTPECSFDIFQGDMIFFYSDGIIEAFGSETENRQQYGEERLTQKLIESSDLPPQLVINNIFDSVYEFIGKHEYQKDDMTAVLIDLPASL
ncbi:MAG: serine/threonine-protein phosphatase [Leptospirales bacterium]|nr:serine/threonine-protein phosphatase [Leptospirales bacterium]